MKTKTKPMPVMKLKTFNVWHGTKQIGQVEATDSHDAYRQARDHHKIQVAVIGREEKP